MLLDGLKGKPQFLFKWGHILKLFEKLLVSTNTWSLSVLNFLLYGQAYRQFKDKSDLKFLGNSGFPLVKLTVKHGLSAWWCNIYLQEVNEGISRVHTVICVMQ